MDKLEAKKTLIIGGSGFVGSFLIKELNDSKVINLDKNQSPFYKKITKIGNILNVNDLNFNPNITHVVLLAAEHKDNITPSSLYYDVNVQGTKNVLEEMDKKGIKNLIFTSSVAIYGLNKVNPDENHIHDPFNHYGKSKWEAELAIKEWFDNDPLNKSVAIIRPTVIFGERNRGNVYNLLRQISTGRFIMIGKGQNKKSMAYVRNVVGFIINRINKNDIGYHIYNYADKPDFSMTELVNVIENKMRLKLPNRNLPYWLGMFAGYCFDILSFLFKKNYTISSVRVKKFCATTQFNASKVHSIYKAPYSLTDGLNKTLEYEFLNKQKKDDILFFTE